MSGTMFSDAVARGEVPPAGPAFLNRFLHGLPDSWTDDWAEIRPDQLEFDLVCDSIESLCANVLDPLGTEGASVGTILAAEDAVTLNMTAFAVVLAQRLIAETPDHAVSQLGTDGYPGWSSDDKESKVALYIREFASSTDAALFTSGRFLDCPGDCVRTLFAVMDQAKAVLAKQAESTGTLQVSIDDFTEHRMGGMAFAMHASKAILDDVPD